MEKIIRGKRYNTETATLVGEATYCNLIDYLCWHDVLYKKRNGEFFLYVKGGAASWCDQNIPVDGSFIKPMTFEKAKAWGEKYLTAEAYEEAFGTASEYNGNRKVTSLSLPISAIELLKREGAKTGKSMSDMISDLIMENYM